MTGTSNSLGARLRRVARWLAVAVGKIRPWSKVERVRRSDPRLSLGQRLHALRIDGATDAASQIGAGLDADEPPAASAIAPTSATSPDAGASNATGVNMMPLWLDVELVVVPPVFDDAIDARILHLLQIRLTSKMLDLRSVDGKALSVAWFERLAARWNAPGAAVPRLGIVLDLERWALWQATILRALQPIADHGVEVGVFYEQQVDRLRGWFVDGKIRHDLAGVLAWVREEWPTVRASGASPAIGPPRAPRAWGMREESWALVLRQISRLIHDHAAVEHVPHLEFELARIAQTFAQPVGDIEALHHLSTVLYWLGDTDSQLKCRALRAKAAAKMGRDDIADALRCLDEAVRVALTIRDPHEAVLALMDAGLYALQRQMYVHAEQRLRRAVEIASPEHPPELRANVLHLLARALLEQGNVDEATLRYAKAALWLRTDTNGSAAYGDRTLLAEISACLASSSTPGSPTAVSTSPTTSTRARSKGA